MFIRDLDPPPEHEVLDEADAAQHLHLRELAEVQLRARRMNDPERHPDFDGHTCVECGCAITQFRLKDGRVRCLDCQIDREAAQARAAGRQVRQ